MTLFAATARSRALPDEALGAALLVVAAWLALYAPLYADFALTAWRREENAHAPFILAIIAGAAWARLRDRPIAMAPARRSLTIAAPLLAAGLAMRLIGAASEFDLLSSASQGVVAGGVAAAFFGARGLVHLWFPLAMTIYLVIWPGWAIDGATGPIKIWAASVVSDALYEAGLPVAHSGAIIAAGPYELLVAKACAGLNSLFALTAVGAVYLYTVKRRAVAANAIVIAALIPIAIAANIARIGALVLITHYFGYDAGQSFLHEAAGLFMFAAALMMVFAVDALAAALFRKPARA